MSSWASQRTLVAVVSASAGALVTLLLCSPMISGDPELRAAEQHYQELDPADAQRLQSTFQRLQKLPEERQRIRDLHNAVTADPELDARLQQLYAWWTTRSDAQRAGLRELHANAELWVKETRQQYTASMSDGRIELAVPSRPGRGGPEGPPVLYVSQEQIDRFLEDAVPDSELSSDESKLLNSVDVADQSLVRILIIARHLFRSRSGGRPIDQNTMVQVYQSAASHLLPGDQPGRLPESQREAARALMLLRAIKNHLSSEFLERHAASEETLEQQFAALDASDRLRLMSADPQQASRFLQTQLTASGEDSPSRQLAAWLDEFDRRSAEAFRRIRSQMRNGGPGGERPRDERRRRGPGGRGNDNGRRFRPGLGGPDDRESRDGRPEDGPPGGLLRNGPLRDGPPENGPLGGRPPTDGQPEGGRPGRPPQFPP